MSKFNKDVVISSLRLSSIDLGVCAAFLYPNMEVSNFNISPSKLIRDIVEMLACTIKEQDEDIRTEMEVDPQKFSSLYQKIVNSKIKYNPKESVKINKLLPVEEQNKIAQLGISNERAMLLLGDD